MNNKYSHCFACGKDNPISLRLKFEQIVGEKAIRTCFIPGPNHQGYDNVMHGGLLTTLLDETMVQAVIFQGIEAVTAEIKVRFAKPVKVGEKIIIIGRVIKQKGSLFLTEGIIQNQAGEVKARAEGKFMEVKST